MATFSEEERGDKRTYGMKDGEKNQQDKEN